MEGAVAFTGRMAHIVIRHHALAEPSERLRAHPNLPWLCLAVRRLAICLSMIVIGASLTVGILARTSGTGAVGMVGHELRPVLSGSMTPTFRVGDAVVTSAATPERLATLAAGDIIVFRVPGHESMVVAHRVAAITRNNQGARLFTTKGDANAANDTAMVDEAHVIGVVTGSVPYLGRVMVGLGQRRTILIFVLSSLLACLSVNVARRALQAADDFGSLSPMPKSGERADRTALRFDSPAAHTPRITPHQETTK